MANEIPMGIQEQIAWLVDRAEITELLGKFSYAIDTKDWDSAVSCFTPDGALILPHATVPAHELKATAQAVLSVFHVTHHANVVHSIIIEGNEAKARQSFIAMHVPDAARIDDHGDVGGWQEAQISRTRAGWRFITLRTISLWTAGDGFPGSPGHQMLIEATR